MKERAARLRPLNRPRAVEVRVDRRGVPTTVVRGDGVVPVASVRETWRIDDEWWRSPISRIYHALVLEGGRLVTVYRDLTDGRWYEQD